VNEQLPRCFRVRQQFADRSLADVASEVTAKIAASSLPRRVRPGQSVAIAVGSRGIDRLAEAVGATVRAIREIGATPFIVPAMGSHGGATAAGQAAVLAEYGISPESIGCEVRSSMEVAQIGMTDDGTPVHFDVQALAADHVVVVNRIKPHTHISGPHESGLVKMMLIGLGKHRGAAAYHQSMTRQSFESLVEQVIPMIFAHCPIALGLGLVENAHDRITLVEAIEPDAILSRETELLEIARSGMPRLPFDDADLLIIDQIGKNISGSGLDTNVVGRKSNDKRAGENEFPKVRQIYVRGLTPQTAGNAAGIGIAEYCRSSLVREMDHDKTRVNCLTALHITAAAIPVHWETDREVLRIAAGQSGRPVAERLRWLWIKDTLHVAEVMCAEAYWEEANIREDLTVLGPPEEMRFDDAGQLMEVFA